MQTKIGTSSVPGVGNVSWRMQVTTTAGGEVFLRVLQAVRILNEGHRQIGTEDPRYGTVARHLGAEY